MLFHNYHSKSRELTLCWKENWNVNWKITAIFFFSIYRQMPPNTGILSFLFVLFSFHFLTFRNRCRSMNRWKSLLNRLSTQIGRWNNLNTKICCNLLFCYATMWESEIFSSICEYLDTEQSEKNYDQICEKKSNSVN